MGVIKRAIAGAFGIQADDLSPSYEAASHGRRLKNWRAPTIGPNSALRFNLDSLRNRSRDRVRQDAIAARASDAWVNNLVGTGIRPLAKAKDQAFRELLHELWDDWQQEADAAGELDFYGLQGQIARAWFEGGECFVRRRMRRPEDGLTLPMQLQVLEAEHLPIEKNEVAENGNRIRYGIEFDAIGRRVAYHFYREHPGDRDGVFFDGGTMTTRVPADEVLHVYMPTRPGQKRGEPGLTQSLITLRDLDQWNDAELTRQKMGAMFLGVIQRVNDEAPPVGEQLSEADEEDVSDGPIDEQTLEPGTFTTLDDGESVNWSDPPEVGGNYETFYRNRLRAAAQSCGVLYEQLTGDYSQINDRTYRAAHNELRRHVERLQQSVLVPQLCRPVWRWFYELGRVTDAIRPPEGMTDRQARRVGWVPQGFRHLHPVQEEQAQRAAVRSGFKSRAEVVSERGGDIHETDAQIAEDNERADDNGLVLDTDPRNVSQSGGAQGAEPGFSAGEPLD